MISTHNLTKTFGEGVLALTILKGISLTINDGEFVAIIGPSGAGKSTLLYHMSLLDEPTSGDVIIDDVATSSLTQVQKTALRLQKLGYIFQDYALLPELTALENVILPLLMLGESTEEATKKAHIAMKRVGLPDKATNLPSQLSGGQQQRVSIARAIVNHPHIVFADEPTANLDTPNALLVMEAFQELSREGQTIIMVTHEDEYAALADRIITLRDGKIVSDKQTGHR